MELAHHRCGICDPAVDLRFQADVGADDRPQVLEAINHVEFLTPKVDAWGTVSSLAHHYGLFVADSEAKLFTGM